MFCPKCGAEIESGEHFCFRCGNDLSDVQDRCEQYNDDTIYEEMTEDCVYTDKREKDDNSITLDVTLCVKAGLVVVLVFITFAVIRFVISHTDAADYPRSNYSGTEGRSDPGMQTQDSLKYEITNVYFDKGIVYGMRQYCGVVEILNTGSTPFHISNEVFDIEDNNGHLLQTDKSSISSFPDVIEPGEKGYLYNYFVGTIDSDVSEANGMRLVPGFTIEKTMEKCNSYVVSDLSDNRDFLGNINVVGRVTNNSSQNESRIEIHVLFYDKDHQVIAIASTGVEDVKAGETKSFECTSLVTVAQWNLDKVVSYEAFATD